MEHLTWLLAREPFVVLGPEGQRLLASELQVRYLASGEWLGRASESLDEVWVVRSGAVRRHQDGPDVVVEEGELIGAENVLLGVGLNAGYEVIEDLLAYVIPGDHFRKLARDETLQRALTHSVAPDTSGLGVVAHNVASRAQHIEPTASVGDAARLMHKTGADAILVARTAQHRQSQPELGQSSCGIVTTRDLRSKVLAKDLPSTTEVGDIATYPMKRLAADTPLAEALVFMLENDIHHAPLSGVASDPPEGPTSLILTNDDILAHYGNDAFRLLRRIVSGSGGSTSFASQVTQAVNGMVRSRVGAGAIGRAVSSLVDGLMRSLCIEAEQQLGPAPVPYAFCACGSQGRREQTLLTDQDNLVVYQDLQGRTDGDEIQGWFDAFTRYVVNGVIGAGIPACDGGYMATNWNGDTTWWRNVVASRAADPDPGALVDLNIFADLRVVAGNLVPDGLLEPLHRSSNHSLLVRRLASSALQFRPPGRFSRFFTRDNEFDVKRQGIIPIVGLARVFGLELALSSTSSASRLDAAAEAGLISQDSKVWLSDGLDFLTGLRLDGQLRSLEQTGSASALGVQRSDLNSMQEQTLRDVLRVIAEVQQTTSDRLGLDTVS